MPFNLPGTVDECLSELLDAWIYKHVMERSQDNPGLDSYKLNSRLIKRSSVLKERIEIAIRKADLSVVEELADN
jgi:hypothetical protein